ncbi:hpr-9 [Pristionchus pacificus]|uniref:Hpr-9 n=1 Tax=Pristionchus pacificus TaxID=54126 RepID=A0A2A6CQG6_PRIPA|nr:hpr-9 [Pristionchus pacificus]|eukprot:PDM80455.1 hpr-9 [Pristionchus pacificus]
MNPEDSIRSQLECSSIAEGVPCGYITGTHKGAKFFMLSNVKVFAKAILALSKVADILNIEPSENGLALKAFHKGRCAYGAFHFSSKFFDEMDVTQLTQAYSSCKISMKSALLIFQAVNRGDRSGGVYGCEITVDPDLDTILVQLHLSSDVTRSYEVSMVDSGTHFRADIDRNKLRNRVQANPEILKEILQQAPNVKELVIAANRKNLIASTFCQKDEDISKSTMQMDFLRASFSKFQIKKKTEISFPTKEFSALVHFASDHTLPINLYFDKPGKPLILFIGGSISYTAEISIATMEGDEEENDEEEEEEEGDEMEDHNQTVGVYNGEDVALDMDDEDEDEQDDERREGTSEIRDESFQVREDTMEEDLELIDNQDEIMIDNDDIMVEKEGADQSIRLDNGDQSERWINESMQPPEEPRRKEEREQEYRRFFLSSSQMTQHASQLYERERILANESDDEEGNETPFKRRKKRSRKD